MRRRHGQNFAVQTVADLTIRIAANRMRNLGRWRGGIHRRFDGRLQDVGESRRIKTCVFPFGAVARAVGAERAVVAAARIARVVTILTGRVKFGAMFQKPGGRFVRLGFGGLFERNDCGGVGTG